jgi:hypothetical protein
VCVSFKTLEPSPIHLFFYPLYPCPQKPSKCPGHATTGFCSRLWWIECEAVPIPLSPDSGLQIRGQSRATISGGASTPTAVALSCSSITSLSFSTRAQNRLMAVNFFGGEVRLALYETCKSLTRKQNTEHLTNRKPATSIG